MNKRQKSYALIHKIFIENKKIVDLEFNYDIIMTCIGCTYECGRLQQTIRERFEIC